MDMARATGVSILLTRNSHHYAALWPDIEPFADQGFIALTCVNSKKRMAAWGGTRPVTGTNALAFACPRADHPPMIWDQSSSVMSQGDVLLAANEGREVPPGVGCDADGAPTTSPSRILDGGALLPFGGHKGASIAVMVELLAAALTGAPFGFEGRISRRDCHHLQGRTVSARRRSPSRQSRVRRARERLAGGSGRGGNRATARRSQVSAPTPRFGRGRPHHQSEHDSPAGIGQRRRARQVTAFIPVSANARPQKRDRTFCA